MVVVVAHRPKQLFHGSYWCCTWRWYGHSGSQKYVATARCLVETPQPQPLADQEVYCMQDLCTQGRERSIGLRDTKSSTTRLALSVSGANAKHG